MPPLSAREIGRVDANGRLIAATDGLRKLEEAAGGGIGQPLRLPRLAALEARMRDGRDMLRERVLAANQTHDLRFDAEMRRSGTDIVIALENWRDHEPASLPRAVIPCGTTEALRAPLLAIVAQAEAIERQDDGPLRHHYADYVRNIVVAGRHLLAVVDGLGREGEDAPSALETVSVAERLAIARGLLEKVGDLRAVAIEIEAETELTARADPNQLLQILVNLLGNALRFSPAGSSIRLQAREAEGRVLVTVEDEGPGVDLEDRERIFDKYVRGGDATEEGSGLGLYIARRLARGMGGDLSVDASAGQGARFVLELARA